MGLLVANYSLVVWCCETADRAPFRLIGMQNISAISNRFCCNSCTERLLLGKKNGSKKSDANISVKHQPASSENSNTEYRFFIINIPCYGINNQTIFYLISKSKLTTNVRAKLSAEAGFVSPG